VSAPAASGACGGSRQIHRFGGYLVSDSSLLCSSLSAASGVT